MTDNGPDQDPVSELRSRIEALRKEFEDGWDKSDELKPAFTEIEKLLDDLEPSDTQDVGMSRFLRDIGESMVKSQQDLDALSGDYLRTVKRSPHLLPTVFRIPKLSAEVKFGMRKGTSEKVGLLFFARRREAQEFQEHTLKFEIAGVPPDPEAFRQLQSAAPGIDFILAVDSRAEILATVRAALDSGGFDGTDDMKKHANAAFTSSADDGETLIASTTGSDRFLLRYYVHPGMGEHVGVWRLTIGNDGPSLEPTWRLKSGAVRKEFERARSVLKPMIDQQRELLEPFLPPST